jgi:nickel/cobalt transporter (NiCoT) family protein
MAVAPSAAPHPIGLTDSPDRVSVVAAVLIGGIEGLGLLGDRLGLTGWFWDSVGTLNSTFNGLGFAIIVVFIFAWVVSLLIYCYARVDDLGASSTRG